ncbi:MAG: ORF6N domain-containing protein [Selenomonas sp.]|nr:ORF6N domain-containing protein [Selenomonas sp.]
MLACGVVRCFSLSIGELVYYKLQNKIFSYFILGTVPSIRLQNIQNLIYVIRGQRVMLDRDLAKAYGVETKALNQAVKRNIKRFEGEDYMFQLTKEECLRSQIVTLNEAQGKHLKYMPYAFTMLGTAMLSSVLRSDTAIETNRKIMRAFVAYRHLAELPIAATYLELKKEIESVRSEVNEILADQNDINESTRAQLDAISTALAELQAKPSDTKTRKPIGFIQPEDDDNDK